MSEFIGPNTSRILNPDGGDDPSLLQSDGPRPHVIERGQVDVVVLIRPLKKLGDVLAAIADALDDPNVTFPEEGRWRFRIPHLVLPERIGAPSVRATFAVKSPIRVLRPQSSKASPDTIRNRVLVESDFLPT